MQPQLTAEEKARSVLCRTGSVGNIVHDFTPAEIDELAGVYDECCAPELALADHIRDFWGRRGERLAALKATDAVQESAPKKQKPRPPMKRPTPNQSPSPAHNSAPRS
jgi:hypothetical protein